MGQGPARGAGRKCAVRQVLLLPRRGPGGQQGAAGTPHKQERACGVLLPALPTSTHVSACLPLQVPPALLPYIPMP
jgi:hypothetical protein